jgi:hypothetical protein
MFNFIWIYCHFMCELYIFVQKYFNLLQGAEQFYSCLVELLMIRIGNNHITFV